MWDSCYRTDDIKQFYKFQNELGKGSFGQVRKVIKKATGEQMAVKIIEKKQMGEDDEISLRKEIHHPNVVNLFEVFDAPDKFYIVLQLMTGGELFDRIIEKEHYSEKEAADTIRPIIDAIRYCHNYDIIHRDLKPQNLLYDSPDEGAVIKISDFGLSRIVKDEMAMTACGTPGYVAPEILSGKGYAKQVDFWSIGVILYIMQDQSLSFLTRLCGFPPFYEQNTADLFNLIKAGDYDFPSPYWDDISDMAKDLIKLLLQVDPKKRMNADDLLKHPWIVGHETPRKNLPATIETMKQYRKGGFKKVSLAVFAVNTLQKLYRNSKAKVPS